MIFSESEDKGTGESGRDVENGQTGNPSRSVPNIRQSEQPGRQSYQRDPPPPYPTESPKRKSGPCGPKADKNGRRDLFNSDFNERKVRQKFVQKVYLTLTWQLLLTSGIVCLFKFVKPINDFFVEYWWMMYIFLACWIVFYLVLMCAKNIRRKFPTNLILLIFFTLIFGAFLGVITCGYDTFIVLIALGITVGVVVCVSLFACQTKADFTSWIGVMFVILIVFSVFGILMIFFYNRWLTLVYGVIGAVIFTVYLAIDTQMVIGGKRYELHEEDWVQGAIILYMDICYIFMFILMASGAIKG